MMLLIKIHLNLLDLKELSRSYNSKTPVLSAAMPGKYALLYEDDYFCIYERGEYETKY